MITADGGGSNGYLRLSSTYQTKTPDMLESLV
jgi:hypothetical protein